MTTKTTKSRNVSVPHQTPAGFAWMTRTKVAEALGCSVPTVRRMEGTTLHPTEDADGVHRFDPVEVLQVLRERSVRAVDPSKEGERDARVFELLDAGKGVRDVVTTLRLPVEVVLKLSEQWREVGRRDLVVPPACRTQLEQCLGPIRDAAELTQTIRSLEAERERLESEKERLSNRIGGLIAIFGEAAARAPQLETLLPDLTSELDAEEIEILDRSFKYHQQRFASTIAGTGEPRDEAERPLAPRDREG